MAKPLEKGQRSKKIGANIIKMLDDLKESEK
jgi:hypothetical protein